jgi:hypothetical protein
LTVLAQYWAEAMTWPWAQVEFQASAWPAVETCVEKGDVSKVCLRYSINL